MFEKLKKISELQANDPLRVKILTLVPDRWTSKKIAEEFGTTVHYARIARRVLENEGIFGEVPKNWDKPLSNETITKMKLFYNSDKVGRIVHGRKDSVSMKVNDVKENVQKRLMLLSLKELYTIFREEFPNVKVGFSTFAKCRPKNCILPGQSGTHSVW